MMLKFMSGEGAPDEDSRKCFHLVSDVVEARFERHGRDGGAVCVFTVLDGETVTINPVEGNVYVLSEGGDLISSFGCAPIPPRPGNTGDGDRE